MKRAMVVLFFLGCGSGCGPSVESSTSKGGQSDSHSGGTSRTSTSDAQPTASSAGTTTGTTTGSATGDETPPPPEGCACVENGFCGALTPECGGEELCPAIVTDCARPVDWYACAGQEVLYDEAALACALDALANRTDGWFSISLTTDNPGHCGLEGCSSNRWRFRILGETQSALRSYCYDVPLSEAEPSNSLAPLESAAYFEACKEQPSGQAQLDCLFDGLLPGEALACD